MDSAEVENSRSVERASLCGFRDFHHLPMDMPSAKEENCRHQ